MTTGSYHPFPNTHWSLVRRAGWAEGEAKQAALADLMTRYAPALRSYLRVVRRLPADQADDLLQGFIADRLLASELLKNANANRGRFRTLLLTSLNHFATSRHRAERRHAALEPMNPDVSAGGTDGADPGEAVDAAWARALIHQVIAAMREECIRTRRPDVWAVFEGRVLAEIFENRSPISYEELARQFDLHTPAQAANLLVTAKRIYGRLLRVAVAEYELESPDIEAELDDLRDALGRCREGGSEE